MEKTRKTPRYSIAYKTEHSFYIHKLNEKEKHTLQEIDAYTSKFLNQDELLESFGRMTFEDEKTGYAYIIYYHDGEEKKLPIIYADPLINNIAKNEEAFFLEIKDLCNDIFRLYNDPNSGFEYFLMQGDGKKYHFSNYTTQNIVLFRRAQTSAKMEYYWNCILTQLTKYTEFRKLYMAYIDYRKRLLLVEENNKILIKRKDDKNGRN